MKAVIALALAAAAATAHAAKMPVYVDCQADKDDAVGAHLCSDLRDTVVRSPRYQLLVVTEEEKSYFEIRVVTVGIEYHPGAQTVSSVVYTIETKESSGYITSQVMVTGQSKTGQQAQAILTDLDTEIDKLFKSVK
jgi:hypothetical protein